MGDAVDDVGARRATEPAEQRVDVDAGQVAGQLQPLGDVRGHRPAQRAGAVGGDDGHLVHGRQRRRGRADDLGQHLDQQVQDGRLAVGPEGLGARVHRLRLRLPAGQDRGGLGGALALDGVGDRLAAQLLGLTALGALDRLGLGERRPAGPLALTGELGLLGGGLGGGDGRLTLRLRRQDRGVLAPLGLLLDPVALGVGRAAHLGVQLPLGQRRRPDGDLLLLGEDRLVLRGLGQRTGRGGAGLRGVGLGGDLGLLERELPLRDRDRLVGEQLLLLGGLPGARLGDAAPP